MGIETKNHMREVLKWAEAAGIERPRIESRSTENLRAQFKRAVRAMTMESA